MKNIIKFATIALAAATFAVSCDLPEYSHDEYSTAQAFNSVSNVENAMRGLYGNLPKVSATYGSEPGIVDYVQAESNDKYTKKYGADNCGNWSWTDLRDINLFIEKVGSNLCTIDASLKPQYLAMGRYFRANKYFNMLVTYGDLPWYDKVILADDKATMFKARDSRDLIIKKIIEDLDYAAANMKNVSPDKSTPDKWCAYFLKSRVCLFEASYRKYHNLTASETTQEKFSNYTVEQLYELSASAAKAIMDGGNFSLNTAAGNKGAYRDLFYSDALVQCEVLLGAVTAPGTNIQGSQNNYFNQAAASKSLVRPFINIFLMKDGTPFTAKAGYETMSFVQEFTDRDPRLAQIVRGPQYKMIKTVGGTTEELAVPDIQQKTAPLGYQVIKFTLDKTLYLQESSGILNTNSTPLYRYAEVLLNYAEAKAELDQLTDADWALTVGALRQRAGITAGLFAKPTTVDTYLKETFFSGSAYASNAVKLEIARERMCELCLEGQRKLDIARWAIGANIANLPWKGLHITALNTPIDINEDGNPDYYFATEDPQNEFSSIWVEIKTTGEGLYATANATSGYDLEYKLSTEKRYFDSSRYYSALAVSEINKYKQAGYVLAQNPGY